MQVIAHNPEVTPTEPELLKLRMARRADGKILAVIYAEYTGLPPGISQADIRKVGRIIKDDPSAAAVQHILDTEVCTDIDAAQDWYERVRKEQPWIKRN